MPHTKPRLLFFVMITLFLSSLCFAQDDPRTLRLVERLLAAPTEAEREALLTAEKQLVTGELVKALVTQGEGLRDQGKFPQARAHYQLAQEIAERIGDKEGLALAFNGFGIIHHRQGDYERALDSYRKSLALSEASSDNAGVAKVLRNIGMVHHAQGDYDRALELYGQSLTLTEMAGSKDLERHTLNGIGLIHRLQGNYRLSLEYHHRAVAMFEAAGDKTGVAGMLNNIGTTYRMQGDYQQALDHHQRSLALAETLNSQQLISYAFTNMGVVHYLQGDFVRALDLYRKSLSIKEKLGDKAGTARTLAVIGLAYREQSNYPAALEHLNRSLKFFEALGEKDGIAEALMQIGYVHGLQGQHDSALESSERAVALASQIGQREVLWEAQTVAGNARRGLNQPVAARKLFEEAIAIIEALRSQVAGGEQAQQLFFENKLAPYHAMVEVLIAEGQPGEALAYAERAKSRVLLDVLRSGRVNINKAMTAPEQARERQLKSALVAFNTQHARENARPQPDRARLAELQARQQTARLDYEAFETSAYAAHPELKMQRGEARVISLADAGALLPDANSALLEYVVTDDKTFLFVLTQARETVGGKPGVEAESHPRLSPAPNLHQTAPTLKVFTLDVKRKDLIERAGLFRRQLAQRDLRFETTARALYDLLVKPARALLRDRATLVIVPDGILWELPFQALQSSGQRYLIEDHALSYAPSLTVLREMSRVRQMGSSGAARAPTLLAFGNPALGRPTTERAPRPTLTDENLGALPEAEKQVKALGQLYGAARSRVYTGAAAREERMKAEAGNFRILQLATHGILNNASPMYSHVVLAQDGTGAQEDGLLEAWEMMNLDLKADLVVLSACETGRGRVGAGEGMIGLTWALFVAGSPTTVVSQWKVEAASTTALMLEFHHRLQPTAKRPHTSTAAALRQASLKLLDNRAHRHPFYWAGFVVVGDGR